MRNISKVLLLSFLIVGGLAVSSTLYAQDNQSGSSHGMMGGRGMMGGDHSGTMGNDHRRGDEGMMNDRDMMGMMRMMRMMTRMSRMMDHCGRMMGDEDDRRPDGQRPKNKPSDQDNKG